MGTPGRRLQTELEVILDLRPELLWSSIWRMYPNLQDHGCVMGLPSVVGSVAKPMTAEDAQGFRYGGDDHAGQAR